MDWMIILKIIGRNQETFSFLQIVVRSPEFLIADLHLLQSTHSSFIETLRLYYEPIILFFICFPVHLTTYPQP